MSQKWTGNRLMTQQRTTDQGTRHHRTGKYRAQVKGVNGWIDFTLFGRAADAERQREFLADHWQLPTRLVEYRA